MFSICYYYLNTISIPYLFLFIFFNIFISIFLLLLSYIVSKTNIYKEKNSPYECGFNPFQGARIRLDIKYYLVAILFIIFDLEIIFLFPWCLNFLNLIQLSSNSQYVVLSFLMLLTIGFIYEWKKGALDW